MISRRPLRETLVLLFAALVFAACGGSGGGDADGDDVPVAAASAPALDGEFATLAGSSIDLGSLEGQDVVLWFWAPW